MRKSGRIVSTPLFAFPLLLAFALFLGFRPGDAAPPAEPPYPKDAPAQWDQRFGDHDAAGLAAQYSESAISMPYNAPAMHGRKAMLADFAKFFAENDSARHETRVAELLLGDGWAVERAEYTLTFTPKATGKRVVETGRHVVCRKREAGGWLIAWELWNTDRPVE